MPAPDQKTRVTRLGVAIALPVVALLLIVVAAEIWHLRSTEEQAGAGVESTAASQQAQIDELTKKVADDQASLDSGAKQLDDANAAVQKAQQDAAVYDQCSKSVQNLIYAATEAELDAAFAAARQDCPGLVVPAEFSQ